MNFFLQDDRLDRALALCGAALVMLAMARLLLIDPPTPQVQGMRIQLRWLPRAEGSMPPRNPSPREDTASAAPRDADTPATPNPADASAAATVRTPLPAARPLAGRLYTREGDARVPPGTVADGLAPPPASTPGQPSARDQQRIAKLLDRRNPIDYRPTAFDKDWKSDGSAGDVAEQEIKRGMAKVADIIFGKEPTPAAPRPPPDVRFNPALHARSADLGSEATGDAYKAAPIAFEKAPDMQGGASRRIRTAIGELERRHARCGGARLQQAMAPALKHLAELQQAETALAQGADPTRAEHLLPRAVDMAYDLARRALWQAERTLAPCAA